MSLHRLYPDDFEHFTLELHPSREFLSSSKTGGTGSVKIFPRGSLIEKDVEDLSKFNVPSFDESTFKVLNVSLLKKPKLQTNIFAKMEKYLSGVHAAGSSERKRRTTEIERFEPPLAFDTGTLKKVVIKEQIFPYYRCVYPTMNWSFSNYNCLNFFTASSVPDSSVLLYPSIDQTTTPTSSLYTSQYALTGGFTFDFWINPKYTTTSANGIFKAGTIFHLSSSYAVSLISGSSKDLNGYVDKFRILLQLSHSADISPFKASATNFPNDLIFSSSDNSLLRNKWHHVSIRWGGNNIDQGSGSFQIDGIERGIFVIPSATIAPLRMNNNPSVLSVGNYFQGSNQSLFFALRPAARYGLQTLVSSNGTDGPSNFVYGHPLNAEVHDLKIFGIKLTDEQIDHYSGSGVRDINVAKAKHSLLFYLPPFFVKESPKRHEIEELGGVLRTPFIARNGSTETPFNTDLSFGVGGHDINLENYVRDFVSNNYPRLMDLTSSQITGSTNTAISANDFLFATASVRKRNLTILPCDNGSFFPNFNLLASGTFHSTPEEEDATSLFVDDLGNLDLGMVSLNNLIPTSSIRMAFTEDSGSMVNQVVGFRPSALDAIPGDVLTVLQRTRDNSSNEVVLLNIPNLYYGNAIFPSSFSWTDTNISGSDGKVKITLKDDGNGNLYRADADGGNHATWNSVGNLLYNEGIAVVKSPVVPFFGKNQFQVVFKGTQNIHTFKINVIADVGTLNSSSNPNYKVLSSSLSANEYDGRYVYITGLNFHDQNLNVVMKSQLAQPIIKRFSDKIKFKIRYDY